MTAHICKQCGKSIKLVPSASERAKKFDYPPYNSPQYYRTLFSVCNSCTLKSWYS